MTALIVRLLRWSEQHPDETILIVVILGFIAWLFGLFPGEPTGWRS